MTETAFSVRRWGSGPAGAPGSGPSGHDDEVHVVAAPDKFRGTLSAPEAAEAVADAVAAAGGTTDRVPMADGGEGFLDAFGGPNRVTTVTGPLGEPVDAAWRLERSRHHRPRAIIEMARASGLTLAGGPDANDAVEATTRGTGELILAAVEAGSQEVLVGVGGSATTDGGLGALQALYPSQRLRGVDLIVACDVNTRFVDAAPVFAAQKGASPAQVELLRRRLERLVGSYAHDYGVEVADLEGGGAAGGLAGGLAAVGARLEPGFDVVADAVDLAGRTETADLVVTGEGGLDAESFHGKVVGGVVELARQLGRRVLVVAGEVDDGVAIPPDVEVVSLVERFGNDRARRHAAGCVRKAVGEVLDR